MTTKYPQHPAHLLDSLIALMKLKNDAALARTLGTKSPVISKLRAGKYPVSAFMLLKMHDASGLSIAELRALLYRGACADAAPAKA